MIEETVHALEGGIKYLEIIVFGFINTSKGKEEKNYEKICPSRHFIITRKIPTVIKTKTQTN